MMVDDTWVAIQFSFLLADQESELDKDMLVVVFDQWLGWDWTSRSTHSLRHPPHTQTARGLLSCYQVT